MVFAAVVSSILCRTSASSVDGVSASARSFAVSPTASAASIVRTAGSSSVVSDFSKKLISYPK